MDKWTERQKREAVAYQFRLQADKLYLSAPVPIGNYKYTVKDQDTRAELTVIVLACSWDFYEYRLHRSRSRADLLVVQRHNAFVPLPVIELDTGYRYEAGAGPAVRRKDVKRPNHEEMLVFVSKLLLGLESAERELMAMSRRTRYRYLQRRNQYLKPRVGRPWAS